MSNLVAQDMLRAVALHREGQLGHAEKIYRDVLARDAKNVDALNLLGVVAQARGRHAEALELFDRALSISPQAHLVLFNRALNLSAMNRLDDAISGYNAVLSVDPNYVDAYINLGASLRQRGDLDSAVILFRKFIKRWPYDSRGHHNLGRCLRDQKLLSDSIGAFKAALKIDPRNTDTLYQLAHVYADGGQLDRAIEAVTSAISFAPNTGNYYSTLGNWLGQLGEFDRAIAAHQTACKLEPKRPEYFFNLGNAFNGHGQFEGACDAYRTAIILKPDYTEAYNNLGETLKDNGRVDEAIATFDKALAIGPSKITSENKAAAITNKALALLSAGRFQEGWGVYRHRFDHSTTAAARRTYPYPQWQGEALHGKSLLLWTDQGLGDEILYSSMAREAGLRAGKCYFECSERLLPLFQRSYPDLVLLPQRTPPVIEISTSQPDAQSSLADLGQYLRGSAEQFPQDHGYLRPDQNLKSRLREKYVARAEGRRIIGISWRSASANHGVHKSMKLPQWESLLRRNDILCVSLQYGLSPEEAAELQSLSNGRVYIDPDIDALTDLDGFAAQVSALDHVISVSNTTVHFAGALGVPVWTLVPSGKGALWYFRLGETTPWYPSMRIFRQSLQDGWPDVMMRVAAALDKLDVPRVTQ